MTQNAVGRCGVMPAPSAIVSGVRISHPDRRIYRRVTSHIQLAAIPLLPPAEAQRCQCRLTGITRSAIGQTSLPCEIWSNALCRSCRPTLATLHHPCSPSCPSCCPPALPWPLAYRPSVLVAHHPAPAYFELSWKPPGRRRSKRHAVFLRGREARRSSRGLRTNPGAEHCYCRK
jgi:hypothetical protein